MHRHAWASLVFAASLVGFSTLTNSPVAARPPSGPIELDDKPEPFVPKAGQTEADAHRRESLSLFAAGLMYEQEDGKREEALRYFQKALRYDPASPAILQKIVETAWALERPQEAIRYALKAAEVAPSNPELLERLAAFLAQEKDYKRAVELYEKAMALQKGKEQTPEYVRMKLLVGHLYAQLEDFPHAADAFAAVTVALGNAEKYGLRGRTKQQLEGEKGRNYVVMGEAFVLAERLDEATAAFDRAFELSGDDALHAYNQAQVLEKQKDYIAALERLDVYFNAESDIAATRPYELLQRLLDATNKSKEFTVKLEALLKDDPKNVPLRYTLAKEYRAQKKFDKAKPLFEDLLRRGTSVEAYEGVIESNLQTGDYARAVEVLAEIVDKTGDVKTVEDQVDELIGDSKKLDAFVAAGRKLAEKSEPEDGKPVALAVAHVLLKAKRYEPAAEFFELALLHDPKGADKVFLAWGLGLFADEQNKQAAKVFARAVDENASPEQPVFQTYLALALEFDGQTEAALEMARKAVELSGGDLRYEVRVPWVLYHAKRYAEAAAAYEELIARFDRDHKEDQERRLLREARISLSNVYMMLHDMPRAERALEQVLNEFPDDSGAQNDLGYLWADQNKNLDLALEMISNAVAADPENRAYRDSLGWVLYRLKRFPEAVAELEKAIEPEKDDDGKSQEPDGVLYDHLGDAYWAADRHDDARKAWQKAEQAFEKAGEKDKLAAVRNKPAK